ncbi:MAG: hypothetical protein IJR67_00055 [Acholeplasmatales bacterium]|nr:hypothetical protein [Acholeplasmatales bacterium]
MSVIIAIKDKDRVVVGCDIRMSNPNYYYDDYYTRPKAIHLSDNIIVGVAGELRILDIISCILTGYIDENISRFDIVSKLIPRLRTEIEGTPSFEDNGEMAGEIIIAAKNRIYI